MAKSKIEWCTRSDWNCIRGCSRVSPGCGGPGPHGGCYAEAIAARFSKPDQPFHGFAERTTNGPHWTGRVELIEDRLTLPLKWRKPARIFVSSTSDLFHEKLPDEAIDRVFAVMALAPQHTFMILTKRPARMRRYLTSRNGMGNSAICRAINEIPSQMGNRHGALEMPLSNVWLGVSAEDQQRADERVPDLLATPAAVHFVSAEPLLGPIDFSDITDRSSSAPKVGEHCFSALPDPDDEPGATYLDWIIVGGESGPRARPMHPGWARSIRDQCAAADASFFFKQWGELVEVDPKTHHRDYVAAANGDGPWRGDIVLDADGLRLPGDSICIGERVYMRRVGKKRAGRLLDGREHNAFPATRIPT